jgi:cyclopropane-fatty-acyl-phospholipid synthase
MFEHVGRSNFQAYFDAISDLISPDGVALIHTIGRTSFPIPTNSWIRKYIFPGGYLPSLSEVSKAVEHSRLQMVDIEVLRGHYERTLAAWRERFTASKKKFVALKGERAARVWEFYLTISEVAFRYTELAVFQLQLARQKHIVPATRDYLYT